MRPSPPLPSANGGPPQPTIADLVWGPEALDDELMSVRGYLLAVPLGTLIWLILWLVWVAIS